MTIPPDLAVEITSPSDVVYQLEEKVEEYLRAGVRLIWGIHPEIQVIDVMRGDGSTSRLRVGANLLGDDVLPGFRCPVASLFPALPRPAQAPQPSTAFRKSLFRASWDGQEAKIMAYRGIRTFESISFLRQGSRPCHLHFRQGSRWLPKDGRSLSPSCVQVPHPRRWPSEYRSSCGPRSRTIRPMSRSPVSSAAIATRSRYGETAMPSRAFPAFKMPRDPADRRSFPPDAHLHVISVASSDPADQGCSATRWSLDDIAQNIVNQTHYEAISRSTIWRILEEADLKPHKSVYWLNSHDPDFDAKAERICQLYVNAPKLYQHGELVICCDEKTGCRFSAQIRDPTSQVGEKTATRV